MLVGAGEIDAALLVVAADDGPRAQTLEHLALLDALGDPARHRGRDQGRCRRTRSGRPRSWRRVGRLLDGTSLAGSPVLAVSAVDGDGHRGAAGRARGARATASPPAAARRRRPAASRLAIDRVFAVKGRGVVVTGTLRGGPLARGATLRLVPGDRSVRVREVQVHGATVEVAGPGRTALNLAGVEAGDLHRGLVLTDDPAVVASDRLLVRLAAPLPDRARARVHLGTAAVDATVGRSGRDALDLPDGTAAAILRLAAPVAVAAGDRLVLRRTSGADRIVGAVVLDPMPARGHLAPAPDGRAGRAARRRRRGRRRAGDRRGPARPPRGAPRRSGRRTAPVAPDVEAAAEDRRLAAVDAGELDLPGARAVAAAALRAAGDDRPDRRRDRRGRRRRPARRATAAWSATARRPPAGSRSAVAGRGPALDAAMDRLERALAVPAPPPWPRPREPPAARPTASASSSGAGRIVVLEPDLAYATSTYREIAATAVALARAAPLTPAALRDATGTSRKYVMAILADLDRRGILRRTPDGHVPGPRAAAGIARDAPSRTMTRSPT